MVHSMMPGTKEQLQRESTTAYLGIDPTADSLHIGHLVSVMILMHLQRCGHKPIALVGGATGMIGDPSMKSQERVLLSEDILRHNEQAIKEQLKKFLNFDPTLPNSAELVNNYDWMKDYTFLNFIRDIGKHITVNYMMAKDSVKKRLSTESSEGMSFTEFSYQLIQGYDFLHLYREKKCRLQVGGSDQWGNITTGTELIRRIEGGEAFALVCPLITKSDGSKFGKTESGNVWLDKRYTSTYQFVQFWLNVGDDEAERYIRIFTFLDRDEINDLIAKHRQAPHLRILQKRLAREVTSMVHSEAEYKAATKAADILFGSDTAEALKTLDEETLLTALEGVPTYTVSKSRMESGAGILELLTQLAPVFSSKGEARRLIQNGGLYLNKMKWEDPDGIVLSSHWLNGRYLLAQKGKKNYYLLIAE